MKYKKKFKCCENCPIVNENSQFSEENVFVLHIEPFKFTLTLDSVINPFNAKNAIKSLANSRYVKNFK